MAGDEVNEALVRSLFDYSAGTGVFTRRVSRGKGRAGSCVGSLDKEGYLVITIGRRAFKAHRLAWLHVHGVWPDGEIDHINGQPADNRIANLRVCDRSTNAQNLRRARRTNRLGILGVSKIHCGFVAQIHTGGRKTMLGTFRTPEAAHAAYLEAKRAAHGGCTL